MRANDKETGEGKERRGGKKIGEKEQIEEDTRE